MSEVPAEASLALGEMADRSMSIQVTIQHDHISITNQKTSIETELQVLKRRES